MLLKCSWLQIGNQSTSALSGRQLWNCIGTSEGRAAPCTADKIRSIIVCLVQILKLFLLGMCQRAPSISDMWAWNKKFLSAPLIFATCQVFLFPRCCTSKSKIVRMEVPLGKLERYVKYTSGS